MSIYDSLEFRHLKYIVAIAEEGTFTAAALRIPVAQSALSRQISEVEDVFGIQIFDRSYDGATLTGTGEVLLGFAKKLLDQRIDVVKAVQAVHKSALRPFKLGFTSFVENEILGAVCEAYRELFPNGEITPESGDTEDLIHQVSDGSIDAALVTLPVDRDGIVVQPVMHERLMICLRQDDPLTSLSEIPPEQLTGKLCIFSDPRHHPKAHAKLLEMLAEQGIVPRLANPTFNAGHIQWMVKERLCLALVREKLPLSDELTIRPIQNVQWTLDSAIVYKPTPVQIGLPLLLRELENRFPVGSPNVNKKRAATAPSQNMFTFDENNKRSA